MKQLKLTIITVFAFLGTTHAQWFGNKKVKGNGNVTQITRSTSDYDAIKCAGSFDYILVAGTEGKITIEGEENLLKYIVTEVKDDKLIVKTENGISLSTSWNKTIKISIPFKDISQISLSGSGDLWNTDSIATSRLDVSLAGSGDIVLDIKTHNVEGSIAGSGDLTLKGITEQLDARVSGSGDFHGFELQSDHTVVSVTGSGDASVISNESIKARVSGSGDIAYKGNPKKEDTKVAGSGSISN
ncbi:MAG: DUF2807 domain-containing protein [Flavobacteriaceae bacterium]|nr:DUF2807 domain-containing protein [Flavobacteriaceae bacterium]